MSTISTGMGTQYADSSRLAARARIHDFGHAEVPWFTWVAQQIEIGPGAEVLDVGCGPAWFWEKAVEVLPERLAVTLFDQSQGMIDEALQRCRSLPFGSVAAQVGDAAALPFADSSFDAVTAMHMLYHVQDQAAAVAECHRVLKPGGILVVTTNDIGDMRELYRMTTVFGSAPVNPAGAAFSFERAESLMQAQFGNVTLQIHPQTMRVTDPEVVYLALTSYPPGDTAPEHQQQAFRDAIAEAFAQGEGGIDVTRRVGVLVSRKT